jgi:hypothetical protein
MQIDLDFHWYNNSIDSNEVAAGTPKDFVWEIMILNPDAATYFNLLRDSWEGKFTAATTTGPPDLITVKWAAASPLLDYAYKDISATSATKTLDTAVNLMNGGGTALPDGGTNDLTINDTLGTDLCTEKWTVLNTK